MANKEKKMAAALAAVSAYMQMEEEVAYAHMAAEMAPRPTAKPNYWGVAGRQGMMNNRSLMELKAFNRLR